MVETNIFSAEQLSEHLQGQDAVISCLGFPYKIFSAISGYADSMRAIVAAMRQSDVSRIIAMTSWYTSREYSYHLIIQVNTCQC